MTTGAADILLQGPARRGRSDEAGRVELLDAGGEIAARSPWQLFWRRFRADRVALVSLGFIVFCWSSSRSPRR